MSDPYTDPCEPSPDRHPNMPARRDVPNNAACDPVADALALAEARATRAAAESERRRGTWRRPNRRGRCAYTIRSRLGVRS